MDWTRGPTIGRGSYASVSLAANSSGEEFAVKSIDLARSSLLQKEKHLLSQLRSDYIVKCLGSDVTFENNKAMYNLFLEYVPGGSLFDQIIDEPTIQSYVYQIVQGLSYLHTNGIVHCDIKGQNILISQEGLKIADFGCAKFVHSTAESTAFCGTPAYFAPEVARCEDQGFPADIWALGCTIIEMATGSGPWPNMHYPVSALYRIGYSDDVPEFPGWLSENGKDFLSKCLVRDAKARWTANELLCHPFLQCLDENCGQNREFKRVSPTSVMDQDFWNAFEGSDSSYNLSDVGSSLDSPADRIQNFLSDDLFSSSVLPDWTDDEDWVTVRDNVSQGSPEVSVRSSGFSQDFEELIHDKEMQEHASIDECLFDNFYDDSSVVDSSGDGMLLMTSTENFKNASVSDNVHFENDNGNSSHSNQCFMQFLELSFFFYSFSLLIILHLLSC